MAKNWFELQKDGVRISVQVVPKSSKNTLDCIVEDADGRKWLKVRVTAPPDKGKANEAVQKLLAKAWKIPVSTISIVSGETGRKKVICITGQAEALIEAIINRVK